jgi:hypothetical protein
MREGKGYGYSKGGGGIEGSGIFGSGAFFRFLLGERGEGVQL